MTPARAINRTGRHTAQLVGFSEFSNNTNEARKACEKSDVIIVHRNLWGAALSSIQHWKARNKKIIADFDDAYQLYDADSTEYAFWSRGLQVIDANTEIRIEPPPLVQFKWGLQMVNAGIVPSKRLADDWQAYNQIEVVPSYIDLEQYLNILPEPHEGIVIGWRGSQSNFLSLEASGALSALRELVQLRSNVKVMVCTDKMEIIDLFGIPARQMIYLQWRPGEIWPDPLAYIDIGLHPLFGPVDQRSNWTNILEYLVMKIPWIASQGPALQDVRPYGMMVENNSASWLNGLLTLVDHISSYKIEASLSPYLFGLGQSIDENIQQVINTYAKICGRVSEKRLRATGSNTQRPAMINNLEEDDGYGPVWSS